VGVPPTQRATKHGLVIEDIVAAVVGLALVVYLFYALARPERF
jgi:K+-transporting ATPase KdpF subunit